MKSHLFSSISEECVFCGKNFMNSHDAETCQKRINREYYIEELPDSRVITSAIHPSRFISVSSKEDAQAIIEALTEMVEGM